MEEDNIIDTILMIVILVVMGYVIAYIIYVVNEPTAMDVYQGKTILEYTYRDGVAVDSVVVFKDK